jgi:hypothetical protein
MKFRTQIVLAALAATVLTPAAAGGAVLTFAHTTTYSGTPVTGGAPWLVATFSDVGNDAVELKLDAAALPPGGFVASWAFNLDPAFDLTALTFSAPAKSGTFADPTVSRDPENINAGGVHGFDLELSFRPAAADRFEAGEAVTYTLGGIPGLSAASFDFHTPGKTDRYHAAAHVQGLPGGGAGWVAATPEPGAAAAIAAVAAVAMLLRRR